MQIKHIEDVICFHLFKKNDENIGKERNCKKFFLSDWELKRLYDKEKNEIILPYNAILSPLSLDWLEYNNVKIIRKNN